MVNTVHTQSAQNVFERQQHATKAQQLRSSVGQDNPTPPRARIASPQPAPHKKGMRAQRMNTHATRSQNRPSAKRKTTHLTLWVKPVVKAELARLAGQEGLSVSTTGAALLERALQQDIHTQHGALLDTIIDKAIAHHMRSYSNRIALLLVRSVFASEQTRSLATNILGRQPGVTPQQLTEILNGSSNAAKRNITRVTPQLQELLEAVEQWIGEGEKTHA